MSQSKGGISVFKKIFIIGGTVAAAFLGVFGIVKNSKKMKMRRTIKRVGSAMYNVGTMLRTLSFQVAQN